ncbi:Cruciform DNA binding protein, partial [Neonectria punicea]
MGSFTFKWEHPAEEVYVTGTFDSWTKSVKLEKQGDVFQKTVDLKDASEKIYYK